jgi:TBC1 domain family protein 5
VRLSRTSQRNLPELAASLVRTPATGSASYSAFPLIDERPSAEQPPWEPRTRFEIEKEISALRLRDKRLGGSLTWIVDTLLQDEEGRSETGHVERIKATKREALECLAYVRDALNGANIELDEERLFGEQEFRRKRNMTRKAKEGSQGLSSGRKDIDLPAPAVPVSISTSASRARHARPDSIHNPFAHRPNANARSRSPPISAASTSPPLSSPLSTSSHPPRQFRAPSSTSLPAPSASLSPSSDSTRLPPWSYTRSNFVTPSSQVTASLPRPPPPTSSVLYPSRATSAAHTPDPADVGDPGRGAGGIPTRTSTASRDPLGALS